MMSKTGEVVSVNISPQRGTVKRPVSQMCLDERGIIGDGHAGLWHRQVSLLSQDSIDRFAAQMGIGLTPGDFGENIDLRGIDLSQVAVLDRFGIADALLEVTQIGKECHGDACAIYQQVGTCIMPTEGLFCRVVEGGTIREGDRVEYSPRPFTVKIITLSDRAFGGEYVDRSGPRIRELLDAFLADKRWHPQVEQAILPDDAQQLRAELSEACTAGVDVIFTTGGTGVGPRDRTPETVANICDKLIPGIMEAIRVKFAAQNPRAVLSRGVAGICGQTVIYTLPGSVKAVEEYMGEILLTMEHVILTLHGLDVH